MTNSPIQQTEELEEYIELRTSIDPIKAFNLFVKRNCPADVQAHFADSDDNEAEFVRRIIRSHTAQAVLSARLEERKAVALDNYRGQTFSESTNYRGKFDKFIRNNERRIAELEATTLNLKGDK